MFLRIKFYNILFLAQNKKRFKPFNNTFSLTKGNSQLLENLTSRSNVFNSKFRLGLQNQENL